MPTLQRFDNSRVLIYIDDHPPPHVHVKLRDGRDCTVDIDSFEIKGRIAEREIREALAWIRSSQSFLFNEWRRNNS
jgi:hypothetical protein